MHRRRPLMVAVMAFVLIVHGIAGQAADRPGLVVDDPQGDAVWPLDTSLNAAWADLTTFRVAGVRDDDGEVVALQFVYVTAEPPRDDDEHRVFFTTGWELYDGVNPWCSASLWVYDGRPGGPWGPPRADLYYSCDGDDKPGHLYLDLKLVRARVSIRLGGPDGTVTPMREGSAMVVTVPLSAFATGLSQGRYTEGTTLTSLYATSGVLWRFMGIGMDGAGGGLLQGRPFAYTIGT
ncbi:MAG TPA: hypothetical protein VHF47_06670 [Acidimicrobiales bacterium]|nr:hypothetical protein [Acidimicrobiales bacterium]